MESGSVGAAKEQEDTTVERPSGPEQEDVDSARPKSGDNSIVSWWDSDAWKEFCNLTFTSKGHLGSVAQPSRAESGNSSKPFDGCTDDATEETIIIYLDEEPKPIVNQPQNQSQSAGAMDMTPLENLRRRIFQGDREPEVGYKEVLDEYLEKIDEKSVDKSPLHKLIDDLTAVSKSLAIRGQISVEENATAGVDSSSSSRIDMDPIQFMRQLTLHNDQSTTLLDLPQVLTDPVITDLWVRERMQEKFQGKYLTARMVNEETSSNEHKEKQNEREKRHLKRRVFDECASEVLTETKQGLSQSLIKPMQELSELKILQDAHRLLLLQDRHTIVELIAAMEKQQTNLNRVISGELPLIGDQAQALSGLMGMAHRTTCALETRINRLSAKDVRDHAERRRVREDRLGRPEALGYLSKAWQDLQLLRDQTQTVIAGLESVETELDGLAGGVMELYDVQKACLLVAAARAGVASDRRG